MLFDVFLEEENSRIEILTALKKLYDTFFETAICWQAGDKAVLADVKAVIDKYDS